MMLADTFGWGAAALMVATFSCRDPLWMRPLAVCTNVAFIGYACTAGLAPVLALHALLLPINVMRWWQYGRQRHVVHPRQLGVQPATAGPERRTGHGRRTAFRRGPVSEALVDSTGI